jgi:hypothetical protein
MQGHPGLLEIYQTYVTSLIAHEAKRQQSNTVFSAIAVGFISLSPKSEHLLSLAFGLALIGIVWVQKVYYYRELSKAKFAVIADLEAQLPYRPFEEEWKKFKSEGGGFELTLIELLIPISLILVAFSVALYSLVK